MIKLENFSLGEIKQFHKVYEKMCIEGGITPPNDKEVYDPSCFKVTEDMAEQLISSLIKDIREQTSEHLPDNIIAMKANLMYLQYGPSISEYSYCYISNENGPPIVKMED